MGASYSVGSLSRLTPLPQELAPMGRCYKSPGSSLFEDASGRVYQDAEATARIIERDPVATLILTGAALA